MKFSLLLSTVLLASITASGQDSLSKSKLTPYASVCISIGHVDTSDPSIDNFNKASYPSVELGMMGKNFSIGAVFGTENVFASASTRGFYELKGSLSKPLGDFGVYGLLGVGAYFERGFNNFIEYGAGLSYMPNKVGCFAQYSNWARSNFVSVGVSCAF